MIVEDSTVVRQLLAALITQDARLMLVAAVASAEEAYQEIPRVRPDVISMDIRLPGDSGLDATRRIMAEWPTPIVVIADSVNDGSLKISMNALRAGALSVVEKPVGIASDGYADLAETICTQLYIMSQVPVIRQRAPRAPLVRKLAGESAAAIPVVPSLVALAASTGGPPALAKVLSALPTDYPAPVLVVQHMGPAFMEGFASWLDGLIDLPVSLARDGETALAGRVYVAPGNSHLTVEPGNILRLGYEQPLSGQRPSATILFQSLARTLGPRGLGVILTGMGEDGARGLLEMRQSGAYTIAESEQTCVVYGMPAAAVKLGGARVSLPLDSIGPRLVQLAGVGGA
ncbi:chemotaxis-specific protein-glutamate methyltransferase CheB [Lacibacterium aquatile]|uniref:Protein-glutamate methylesterase/protein-glutamine glutaminase n=2 Tax=Lacibacterium aquatile TaxID=1168082 RepID=A0ABW5DPL5_9PROT